MLITHNELLEFANAGVIEGVTDPAKINAASIDVHLGGSIWCEDSMRPRTVDLARKQGPEMYLKDIEAMGSYTMHPGEFLLAQTVERFNLPDDIALEFRLKSSAARAGLDNALATWGDPGWHGSVLTLELKNNLMHHRLELTHGMPIGQIIFWRGAPVPQSASYAARGQYNNDIEAQRNKGVR